MKKALVAIVLIALLFTLCACGIPANSFMSKTKVNSLAKKIPNPQAVVTLSYTKGNDNFDVAITYDLLLEQAPIAVIRFIQIASKSENSYENTIVDTLNTSDKYLVMGRYEKRQDNKYFNVRTTDSTFIGEFKSNDYREPSNGYAEFKILSLAMFHEKDSDGEHFNSADGTLIMSLANDITLNSANYAVFAQWSSITVVTNGKTEDAKTYTRNVPSLVQNHLMGFTSRTTQSIYDASDDGASSVSVSIVSSAPTLSVRILGVDDLKKLPTIR